MDTATLVRYLDTRIKYGEEAISLLQRRGEADAINSLLHQLQDLKGQRKELAQIHTPSKNLVVSQGESEGLEPWMLREWRRVSIPDWRRILKESIEHGDAKREQYARWMLREMLLDSEYEEPEE